MECERSAALVITPSLLTHYLPGTDSGPNHGHYVSIIKTMGTWFVFDDETVDSIKECDIPKYFGDSNSGSAYVLYYQAVDIDLTALGFRPPSPEPVIITVPQSEQPQQMQPTDSPASTAQSIPPLPPGLTDDLTNTCIPDALPRPTTPPKLIQIPLGPCEKSPRKAPSQFFARSRPATAHGNARPLRPVLDEKVSTISKPMSPVNIFTKDDLKLLEGPSDALLRRRSAPPSRICRMQCSSASVLMKTTFSVLKRGPPKAQASSKAVVTGRLS